MGKQDIEIPTTNGRLNTTDLMNAMTYVVTRGGGRKPVASDFDLIINSKDWILSVMPVGNEYYEYIRTSKPVQWTVTNTRALFDLDGNGRITSNDFLKGFEMHMAYLDRNRPNIDFYLPCVGQAIFGMFCGWMVGRFAYRAYMNKTAILIFGAAGYLSFQYMVEEQVINKAVILKQLEDKVRNTLDINGDGKIDRKDFDALMEKKFSIIVEKLGPDVFVPGIAGAITFGLGMMRGFRFI